MYSRDTHKPAADVSLFISVLFLWTFLMAYSKVKLKSNGDKASLVFKYILNSLTSSYENTVQYFSPNWFIGFPEVYE
jgi:hypothetical protein